MKIKELLKSAYDILKTEEIDSYILDSQLLLGKVLNKDKLSIIMNMELEVAKNEEEEFFKLVEARKRKTPVKYLLGECEFMGINFKVREGVLIPRPDTETLVSDVIEEIKRNKYKEICDVCCGSGIIGISIARYVENVRVSCFDISEIACDVTKENIETLSLSEKVSVYNSDLLKRPLAERKYYDCIISNPPYIKESIIPTLMEDVKNYEPYIALCGGDDGLHFYRSITEQSLKLLNDSGLLAYEIGHDQGEAVAEILKNNGFIDIRILKDLAGFDRVVKGTLKK